ncbi:MAG TPA: hypothetical protein DCQ92_15510 [Verrucomicrobia subdivision 3 bacterium]|nr:hypothetical protein [Limisphaerales bacterium]
MKRILPLLLAATIAGGCSRNNQSETTARPQSAWRVSRDTNGESVVTLDAATQQGMGLKLAPAPPLQLPPERKAFGRVLDPAQLSSAAADFIAARAAATAAQKELARLQQLAAQANASLQILESAQAAAARDSAQADSARSRFVAAWGQAIADRDDLSEFVQSLAAGESALVRLDLPAGEMLQTGPTGARVTGLGDETNSVEVSYLNAIPAVNPQTQGRSFLFWVKPNSARLVAGEAVTGWLKISGTPVSGVVVPADAVVHTDGRDWIYVQTADDSFSRKEIVTDHPVAGGWFVGGTIAPGEKVVVAGAQQLLSTELVSQSPPPS